MCLFPLTFVQVKSSSSPLDAVFKVHGVVRNRELPSISGQPKAIVKA